MGLSAHLRREGFCALSVKMALPVEQRREAIAESFLSVKPSPRGKTHSVRVTPLSVMGLNPVVVTVGGRRSDTGGRQSDTDRQSDTGCYRLVAGGHGDTVSRPARAAGRQGT
jgi:hypothetical protein